MPDFSKDERAKLLAYLLENPNVGAFEGWRNGPRYTDSAQMQSWKSLQGRSDYDHIDRAMYAEYRGA
jgi:hypothetical protein